MFTLTHKDIYEGWYYGNVCIIAPFTGNKLSIQTWFIHTMKYVMYKNNEEDYHTTYKSPKNNDGKKYYQINSY